MRLARLLLLALILPPPGAAAQSPPAPEAAGAPEAADQEARRPDVRLGVELVQIDVVVTDKKGKKVKGLEAGDFEIFEDGRRQEITNFAYVDAAARPVAKAPRKGTVAGVAPPPRKLRSGDVRRVFALVVDDLFLSVERVKSVKLALRKFVDEQMQAGDLVAVVLTSKGSSSLQQFTTDKRMLHLAIDRIQWNPRGARGIQSFDTYGQDLARHSLLRNRWDRGDYGLEPRGMTDAKPSLSGPRPDEHEIAADFRDETFAVGSIAALDYVVRNLKDLPGRKSLVWFTEGFSLFTNEESNSLQGGRKRRFKKEETRALELTRLLADRTNRAGVVFYPVDVRGLTVPYMVGAEADPFDKSIAERGRELELAARRLRSSQDAMKYLASSTGGLVYSANDPVVGVRKIVEDQESYYLIGYVPAGSSFEAGEGAPKYHEIDVRVKDRDLRVRSRSGFFGYVKEEGAEALLTPAQRLAAAVMSPVAVSELDVTLSAQYLDDAAAGIVVRSTLHVDARRLTFEEKADGAAETVLDVVAFATGESGEIESIAYETQTVRVAAGELEQARKQGVVYTINLPIEKHGPYQVRAAVRDTATGRIGSGSEFVVVPDPSEARLAVSGVALKSGDSANNFLPGSDVTYYFAVYNAEVDPQARQARLRMRITLWRDGELIHAGEDEPIDLTPQPDWKRINAVGSFALGAGVAPGEYTLQIDVVDTLASKKRATATQWIDFEVSAPGP